MTYNELVDAAKMRVRKPSNDALRRRENPR